MILILPASLIAEDAAAMLRSGGGVLVNKKNAPATIALFPDDLVETQSGAAARLEISGSTADINQETVVQFESDELVLDHGTVSVNTSRGLRVRVGCVLVTPVHEAWTQYQVTDVNGKVTVSALKDDVNIDSRSPDQRVKNRSGQSDRVSVHEGEQKSREEKCGPGLLKPTDQYAARGAFMNTWEARTAGIVAVGIITCYALCRTDNKPLSPATPDKKKN